MATDIQRELHKAGLADLLPTPEWRALSGPQQAFSAAYIASGVAQGRYDSLKAARVAYPKVKASAVWASRLMQNRRIKKVIALHLGMTETEVVLGDVKALIKKSKRKGAHLNLLVPYWIRTVAALEALAAKENVKSTG